MNASNGDYWTTVITALSRESCYSSSETRRFSRTSLFLEPNCEKVRKGVETWQKRWSGNDDHWVRVGSRSARCRRGREVGARPLRRGFAARGWRARSPRPRRSAAAVTPWPGARLRRAAYQPWQATRSDITVGSESSRQNLRQRFRNFSKTVPNSNKDNRVKFE